MAKSTGIILTAAGISFANEFVQSDGHTINIRILVAGGALALLFDGLEKVNEQAAVGLSVLALITILVTPFNGNSPLQTVAGLAIAQPKKQ
jgi:low temperature requirement protein LtrA